MGNACTGEFKLKHFAFRDCPPDRFYKSQWTNSKWVFLGIKFVFLTYWFAWFVVSLATSTAIWNWWIFLTNWGVVTMLTYFLASFAITIYGLCNQREDPITAIVTTVSGTIAVETKPGLDSNLPWIHTIIWILQSVSTNVAIVITLLFWTLLAPANSTAVSINTHAINMVIMIIDLFVIDLPVRLLHFYHTALYATVYTVFTLILHGSGYISAVYSILNWSTGPGLSAVICIATIFIGSIAANSIVFALYQLRLFIARETALKRKTAPLVPATTSAHNPAYERDENIENGNKET